MEDNERSDSNGIQLGIISPDFLGTLQSVITAPDLQANVESLQTNEVQNLIMQDDAASNVNNLAQLISTTIYTAPTIDTVALHFIPQETWNQKAVSLQYLAENYFSRKNNVTRRFEHKLWNALRITSAYPAMIKYIGVAWVTDTVFKVYKQTFAKLLNITCVDGGLFHKQGNFTRHGFVILPDHAEHQQIPESQLEDVDHHDVVLMFHKNMSFTSQSSEDKISTCKWENPNGAPRVASLRMSPLHQNIAADEL